MTTLSGGALNDGGSVVARTPRRDPIKSGAIFQRGSLSARPASPSPQQLTPAVTSAGFGRVGPAAHSGVVGETGLEDKPRWSGATEETRRIQANFEALVATSALPNAPLNQWRGQAQPAWDKTVTLERWWLAPWNGDDCLTAVCGSVAGSSRVVKVGVKGRCDATTLVGSSAERVTLVGHLEAESAKLEGVPSLVAAAFRHGFPDDWERLLTTRSEHIASEPTPAVAAGAGKGQERRAGGARRSDVSTDTVATTTITTARAAAAAAAASTPTTRQRRDSFHTADTTLLQTPGASAPKGPSHATGSFVTAEAAAHVEPTPTSKPKGGGRGAHMRENKEARLAAEAAVAAMAVAGRTARGVRAGEEQEAAAAAAARDKKAVKPRVRSSGVSDSKEMVLCETVHALETSRSGRVRVPPLEYWRDQRIAFDPKDGSVMGVLEGHPPAIATNSAMKLQAERRRSQSSQPAKTPAKRRKAVKEEAAVEVRPGTSMRKRTGIGNNAGTKATARTSSGGDNAFTVVLISPPSSPPSSDDEGAPPRKRGRGSSSASAAVAAKGTGKGKAAAAAAARPARSQERASRVAKTNGGCAHIDAPPELSSDVEDDEAERRGDEEVMEVECEVCEAKEDTEDNPILLCDGPHLTEVGYHARCLSPPLLSVPDEDWFCPACVAQGTPQKMQQTAAQGTSQKVQKVQKTVAAPALKPAPRPSRCRAAPTDRAAAAVTADALATVPQPVQGKKRGRPPNAELARRKALKEQEVKAAAAERKRPIRSTKVAAAVAAKSTELPVSTKPAAPAVATAQPVKKKMGRLTNAERERRAKEAEAAAAEAPASLQATTSKTDPCALVIAAAAEPAPAPKKRGRPSNAELARRKALKEAAQEMAAAAPSTPKPEEAAAPKKRGGKAKAMVDAPGFAGAGADSNGDVSAGARERNAQSQEPAGTAAAAAAAAEGLPTRTAVSPRKAKKAAVQALAEQSCVDTPPTEEKKMRGHPKAAKNAEASEAGTGNVAGEAQAAPEPSVWTKADVEALRSAVSKVDPLSNNLWREIAEMVPGKTHEECYSKHFEGVDQPIQVSMKRKPPTAPSTKAAEAGGISAAAALGDGRAKPPTTLHQAKLARREQQWKQRQNELTQNSVFDYNALADGEEADVDADAASAAAEQEAKLREAKARDRYVDSLNRIRATGAGARGSVANANGLAAVAPKQKDRDATLQKTFKTIQELARHSEQQQEEDEKTDSESETDDD